MTYSNIELSKWTSAPNALTFLAFEAYTSIVMTSPAFQLVALGIASMAPSTLPFLVVPPSRADMVKDMSYTSNASFMLKSAPLEPIWEFQSA